VLGVIAALGGRANIAALLGFGAALCNLLLLPGVFALVHSLGFETATARLALPVVAVIAVLLHLLLRRAPRIGRREGLLLVLAFIAFAAVEIGRAWH